MVKITPVTPIVSVRGNEVDVRTILSRFEDGAVINTPDILEALDITGASGLDAINVIDAMHYFAHIHWNTPVEASQKSVPEGFVVYSKHLPEEMVEVKRTKGPSAGKGGAFIVPESIWKEQYPPDDGFDIISRYILTEAVN